MTRRQRESHYLNIDLATNILQFSNREVHSGRFYLTATTCWRNIELGIPKFGPTIVPDLSVFLYNWLLLRNSLRRFPSFIDLGNVVVSGAALISSGSTALFGSTAMLPVREGLPYDTLRFVSLPRAATGPLVTVGVVPTGFRPEGS